MCVTVLLANLFKRSTTKTVNGAENQKGKIELGGKKKRLKNYRKSSVLFSNKNKPLLRNCSPRRNVLNILSYYANAFNVGKRMPNLIEN